MEEITPEEILKQYQGEQPATQDEEVEAQYGVETSKTF